MNSISIIGCGWLGLPLGEFLTAKGFEVKGSTTSKEKLGLIEAANIQAFQIKANPELVGENLEQFFESQILIINIPPRRRRENVETLHFEEVRQVLNAAEKGAVEKVIFCSSTGVYPDNNEAVTEAGKVDPQTGSTKALVKIENYLQDLSTFKSTILRFSGLVGGDRKAGRFLAGKKNVLNGNAPVNLVHRADCVQVIYEVIKQEVWNDLFNVCADEHPLRKDFYTQQALRQGFEAPEFLEEDSPSFKVVSNQKLKTRLNYQFIHPDPNQFA